jgi:hypothetical protein
MARMIVLRNQRVGLLIRFSAFEVKKQKRPGGQIPAFFVKRYLNVDESAYSAAFAAIDAISESL